MASLDNALACGITREILAVELWRRSAEAYLMAGELSKSGESWLKAGDKNRAAELFFESGEDLRAAELFFDCNRFVEALKSARRCRENSSVEDFPQRIAAQLVAAAACSKSGDKKETVDLLRVARAELVESDSDLAPFQAAQAWESLARFGCRVKRPDLIRLGYEKALAVYGAKFNLQRLRSAYDYLKAVAGDHILESEIERRIAEYRHEFTTHK